MRTDLRAQIAHPASDDTRGAARIIARLPPLLVPATGLRNSGGILPNTFSAGCNLSDPPRESAKSMASRKAGTCCTKIQGTGYRQSVGYGGDPLPRITGRLHNGSFGIEGDVRRRGATTTGGTGNALSGGRQGLRRILVPHLAPAQSIVGAAAKTCGKGQAPATVWPGSACTGFAGTVKCTRPLRDIACGVVTGGHSPCPTV